MINGLNQFVFKATLLVLLFGDLAKQDFAQAWNGKFVAFCFVVTLVSISLVALMSMALKDKSSAGEFIQGAYRSSAAILALRLSRNIYGNSGMAPLMIIGSVPLYNIMAVVVLSLHKTGTEWDESGTDQKTLKGIATNPIILGILAGALWSVLQLPMPTILTKTVSSLGGLTTPLGLMAMGAAFNWSEAKSVWGRHSRQASWKLIGLCTLFLPVAVLLGFREAELIAILVSLGSSTHRQQHVMARNMGHSGVLSSEIVAITTLSAFS